MGLAFLSQVAVPAASHAYAQPDPYFDRASVVSELNLRDYKYGPDFHQRVHFLRPKKSRNAPLVIIFEDEAWDGGTPTTPTDWLRLTLVEKGYAIAVVEYRWEDHEISAPRAAGDAAAATRFLAENSTKLGFDRDRVALLGIGAGAHFAALLATDTSLLADERIQNAIKAVLSVNGFGFDIPGSIAKASAYQRTMLQKAFGSDSTVQANFSPKSHVDSPNSPAAYLFQMVDDKEFLSAEAEAFSAALEQNGAVTSVERVPPYSRRLRSSIYGAPDNPGTARLLDVLEALRR